MDNQSIQHTRWNCTYLIVFIPKYRRKITFVPVSGQLEGVMKFAKVRKRGQNEAFQEEKYND